MTACPPEHVHLPPGWSRCRLRGSLETSEVNLDADRRGNGAAAMTSSLLRRRKHCLGIIDEGCALVHILHAGGGFVAARHSITSVRCGAGTGLRAGTGGAS